MGEEGRCHYHTITAKLRLDDYDRRLATASGLPNLLISKLFLILFGRFDWHGRRQLLPAPFACPAFSILTIRLEGFGAA
jgi:hypothetical protein